MPYITHHQKFSAYSLLETILAFVMVAIIAAAAWSVSRPGDRIDAAQKSEAVAELQAIAKAIQLYSLDNGSYPPDASRGSEPPGLNQYLTTDIDWSEGPIPGSIWDYDNWIGTSCIDPVANDSVQISLRNIPNRNPDGTDVWAWYVPVNPGAEGAPHCDNANEYDKGERIDDDFDITADID